MRKNILSILCAVALVTPGVQSALAESVAVKGDSIFILDNSVEGSKIVVKNLTNNSTSSCLTNAGLSNLGLSASTSATDIVIKNGTAVITTYNNTTSPATDVTLVDVTSCPITNTVDLSDCYATIDGDKLTIPCLQYGGDLLSVVLKERGNSSNFELESYKPGKSHGHGSDD
jgi:hypothetical protein